MEDCFTSMVFTRFICKVIFIKEILNRASLISTNKLSSFVFLSNFFRLRLWISSSLCLSRLSYFGKSFCFSFIEIVSILNSFLFFNTLGSIIYHFTFPEFYFDLFIGMRSCAASLNLLEWLPIICYLLTAVPAFLDVVEYWFSWMKTAGSSMIIRF